MSLRSLLTPPLLGLLASACAVSDSYPSLLPRAAEKQSLAEPVAPAPEAAVADPALDVQIAQALRTLQERTAAFDAAATRAATRVAAAGRSPAGSEAWLDAQVALAELDTARSATLDVVSTLDDLAGTRAMALAPDYPALTAALDRARAKGDAQRARIIELQGVLAPA
jgi:hypothetical protein